MGFCWPCRHLDYLYDVQGTKVSKINTITSISWLRKLSIKQNLTNFVQAHADDEDCKGDSNALLSESKDAPTWTIYQHQTKEGPLKREAEINQNCKLKPHLSRCPALL